MQSLAEKKVEIFTSWEIAKKWSDTYVTEVDRENFLAKFKHDKYESEWVSFSFICAYLQSWTNALG